MPVRADKQSRRQGSPILQSNIDFPFRVDSFVTADSENDIKKNMVFRPGCALAGWNNYSFKVAAVPNGK